MTKKVILLLLLDQVSTCQVVDVGQGSKKTEDENISIKGWINCSWTRSIGKQKLLLPTQPGAFNDDVSLLSVSWAVSRGRHKPKALIRGSCDAFTGGQNTGPQTGCDPYTCLVALNCNMAAQRGGVGTNTLSLSLGLFFFYPDTHWHDEKETRFKDGKWK